MEFQLSKLLEGRPNTINSEKERVCYDILDSLNINYQRVEYNFFPSDKDNLNKIDEKVFRTKYELSKIGMAKEEDLKALLNTHTGAVSIMELVCDTNNVIKLFIDEKILNEKYFRFHPNENNSTVRISISIFET